MDVRIEPSSLSGSIKAIPSKSDAHRLLIAALLSETKAEIHLPSRSNDIEATLRCISVLGAVV